MASSITTWQRLEPLARSPDLRPGLRAEIADPLWLLARQRQFGELSGEDAGSPVRAKLTAASGQIARIHLGVPGNDAADIAFDYDVRDLPLEAAVEREIVRGTSEGAGLGVEMGLQFLRLLRVHRAGSTVTRYLSHYAFRPQDFPGSDDATVRLSRRAIGRVPDGRRIYSDLSERRGANARLTALPAQPAIASADRAKILEAANRFLRFGEALLSEPSVDAPSSWQASRLEHAFALQAELPSGRVVLRADENRGGKLDWHAFSLATGPDLGSPQTRQPPRTITRTVIPATATYGGMPASRFWEIEDGSVRFGALTTGRTDLARLILAEFALAYGADWFVLPVDLPIGSVCEIESLEVTDTFGEMTNVGPGGGDDASTWRMFELAKVDGAESAPRIFFLPPTLAETQQSDPVEEVAFVRDEMANIVWGIERRYQGAAGASVDRSAEHQHRLAHAQHVDVDIGDAQVIYRLASDVPYHWFPFVPIRPAGAPANQGVIELERRPLVRILARGVTETPEPRGRVLKAEQPLRVAEEEVSRVGVIVTRNFSLARWTDGRHILWSGRGRSPANGEAASKLRFDVVSPAIR